MHEKVGQLRFSASRFDQIMWQLSKPATALNRFYAKRLPKSWAYFTYLGTYGALAAGAALIPLLFWPSLAHVGIYGAAVSISLLLGLVYGEGCYCGFYTGARNHEGNFVLPYCYRCGCNHSRHANVSDH